MTGRREFILGASAMAVGLHAEASADAVDSIVINKAARELLLLSKGKLLHRYRVALGRNPVGAKERQGDGRTPEGHYTISGRNPKSAFHKSLRVSYPEAANREHARRLGVSPGGDIMIHGLPNGQGAIGAAHRQTDWTEGCVAVTDEEIEEIWRLVADGTAVTINP
jgi:murein L,D-transpeptidase YafK